MTDGNNVVTVNGAFGSTGQGRYAIFASGTLMDSSYLAVVNPVYDGILDSNGNLSVQLLASDNSGFNTTPGSYSLLWNFIIQIQGLPEIIVRDAIVNYSNASVPAGASTQNLFALLNANGWQPQEL